MTVEELEIFANKCHVPLLLGERFNEPVILLTCFESDKKTVEEYLYKNLPMWISKEIITVPNQIEDKNYTQKFLLEYEGATNGKS